MSDKDVKVTDLSGENGEFSLPGDGVSLVFENGTVKEEAHTPAASVPEQKPADPVAPPPDTPASPVAEEFSVHDTFTVNERYNTAPPSEEPPRRIWTTYVPRFTEVSENYRMASSPRPAPRRKPEPEPTVIPPQEVDPTADTDNEQTPPPEDTVIVDVSTSAPPPPADTVSVFKFPAAEQQEEPSSPPVEPDIPPLAPETPAADFAGIAPAPPEEHPPVTEPAAAEPTPPRRNAPLPDPTDVGDYMMDFPVTDLRGKPLAEDDAPREQEAIPPESAGKKEYAAYAQRDYFKDRFLDTLMALRVRFCAAFVVAFGLFLYELLPCFGVRFGAISAVRGMSAYVDLFFLVCLFALALPEVIRAVRSALFGKPVPELFLIAYFAVFVAYSLLAATGPSADAPLFGSAFGAAVLIAISATYWNECATFSSFRLVSERGEKNIVDRKATRDLPRENMALDGAVDEYKSRTARVFRTSFVTDFFARNRKTAENSENVLLILAVSLGVSLVTAVVTFFLHRDGGLSAAACAFLLVFCASCPAFSVLLHKLPYFCAQRESAAERSTFIGETSLGEYAKVDVVAFEDTEVFGPKDVKFKRIMLYRDNGNYQKALRQMSSLFAAAGGPLNTTFSDALDRKARPADSVVIEEDGISGEFEGHLLRAGTRDYMERCGARFAPDDIREKVPLDGTRTMYAAEDGIVYAKFYIRYSFSDTFTGLLPELREEGVTSLIYTRDPNLNNDLLRALTAGADCLRVMKKNTPAAQDVRACRRVSAGAVTMGDKISAINMIFLARRYTRLQSRLAVFEVAAMGAGALLSVILALCGVAASVPAAVLVVWQLALAVAVGAVSYRTFRVKKDGENPSAPANGNSGDDDEEV